LLIFAGTESALSEAGLSPDGGSRLDAQPSEAGEICSVGASLVGLFIRFYFCISVTRLCRQGDLAPVDPAEKGKEEVGAPVPRARVVVGY
jgi:hypothetical protein